MTPIENINMPRTRKRHQKEISKSSKTWPTFFIEPSHEAERDVLRFILKKDTRLNKVYFTIQMMKTNYMVFRRNYQDILKLQSEFDNPMTFNELAMETDKAREITSNVILEYTRLLHNFLASAMMLVDLTRNWVSEEFNNTGFIVIYKKEIDEKFTNNVQARFLKDLRNFTLHRTLPLAVPELRFEEINSHTLKSSLSIVLLKDYLLEWENWSELGRMQIQMAFDGNVDIQTIINSYFESVTEFTQWLFWQTRTLFDTEIQQINSAIQSLRQQK